jgi:hypothetical protein
MEPTWKLTPQAFHFLHAHLWRHHVTVMLSRVRNIHYEDYSAFIDGYFFLPMPSTS